MSTPFDPQPCCGGGGGAPQDVNVVNTVAIQEPVDVNVLGTVAIQEPVDVNVLGTVSVAEPVDVNVLGTVSVAEPVDVNVLGTVPVTGTVAVTGASDSEILCDSTPTRFVRTYIYGPTGTVASVSDTTLAGAPFVPVGAVTQCGTSVTAALAGSTAASPTLTAATTGNGTTVDFANAKQNVSMFIQVNGTVTAGAVELQVSQDGTNWSRVAFSSSLATGVNQNLSVSGVAFRWFRGVVSDTVTGGGSVTATLMFS